MRSTTLTFSGAAGAGRSAELFYPPDNRPQAIAVFAHCFPPGSGAASNIRRALNDFGLAVLDLDLVKMSEVAAVDARDIVTAAKSATEVIDLPLLLVGHSFGGAMMLRAAGELEDARAVALLSTPAGVTSVRHMLLDGEGAVQRIRVGGRVLNVERSVIDHLEEADVRRAMALISRPLIMFHSPRDEEVAIESAERVFRLARHPRSFVSLDHADHLLSDELDSRYAAHVLAAWARRYLDVRTETTVYTDERDNRVSARTGPSGYRTEIIANGYPLVADEPESLGGTDTGPTPYDYLAAALGACTSMTLRMYADHKKLSLDAVTTRVRHTRVHVKDCEDCPDDGRHLDRLEREIELEGVLTDAQRERMVEIANRCPVHRTLTSEVQIMTDLAPEAVAIADKM